MEINLFFFLANTGSLHKFTRILFPITKQYKAMFRKSILMLSASILFFSSDLIAQPDGPWVKSKNTSEKTFAEYQQEFNEYWENKTPEKGQGFKQFKRWEHFWQSRLLRDGRLPSSSYIWSGIQQAKSNGSGGGTTKDQSLWTAMGPSDYELTGSWSAGHGRINVVAVDPNDPSTIYIGAPAGGIWKSTDNGQSWVVLNDQLGVIGVSSIAIDPNNSDIIYIATGDDDAGDTYSIGIMKSTDGGVNWNTTGLTLTGNSKVSNVVIDPDNSQIVYASTNSGLYKSTNAGTTFNIILAQSTRDFSFKPGDSQTIYTVTSSSFYRSTNGGTSFSEITSGLPGSDVSRIVIGVTPANSAYVYLSLAANNNGYKGLYRSTNSGTSFSLRGTTPDIYESTQAWYDLAIAIDPSNADIVYHGVLNVWKSTNGGTGFTKINSWSNPTGASYTHADIHYLGFFGNALFCGSDGGIYKSTNGAVNFTDLSPGLQIGQFYEIDGTEQNSNAIVGGLQDNGGYYTQTGPGGWKNYYGADGMGCAIDFTNPDIVYGAIQFASNIYKSTNGGDNISNIGSPESGAWVTPLQLDPNDHNRLLVGYTKLYEYTGSWNALTTFDFGGNLNEIEVAPSNSNVIYISRGANLYKTINGGTAVTQLSGLPGNFISDIVVHNTDQNTLWITFGGWTNGTKVYKSTNGGSSWTNISGALPNIPVNCVVYQHDSNDGIYIGNDIGVYYYDETVGVWDDFFKDLPHTIVNDLVINHAGSIITAGTYGRGVWQSNLYSSTLLAVNPFLVEIMGVPGMVCNSSINPGVKVKNLGTDELTSFTLEYGIGNYNLSYQWTGSLLSLEDITINLDPIAITEGSLVFQVRVVNPNNGADDDESNNQKEINFNAVPNGEFIAVHLETDCWGEETTWEIRDANNNTIVADGPFDDLSQFDFLLCLNAGCYQFIINDSFGDGLAGQASGCSIDGDYSITDGQGNVLIQMPVADFGYQAVHDFCVEITELAVSYSISTAELCQGNSVDFTDLSGGNPISWAWEFEGGNPATSDLQNPVGITYATPGNYDVTLTITDSDDESVSETSVDLITVAENPAIAIEEVIDVICFDEVNGSIEVSASDGFAPYQYAIDDGVMQNSGLFEGVDVGAHSLIAKDNNGCYSNNIDVQINEPAELQIEDVTITDLSCDGNDGAIDIAAMGGVPPYVYAIDGGVSSDSGVFEGLSAGLHSVIITDFNDCTLEYSFTINQPDDISVGVDQVDILCFGLSDGSVTLNASGEFPPFEYALNGGEFTAVNTFSNLSQGDYTYQVRDANGCIVGGAFNLDEPEELVIGASAVVHEAEGDDGFIEIEVDGGTPPYTYEWSNGSTEEDISGLSGGTYTVIITDANGCTYEESFIVESTVGIDELLLLNDVKVFPNPANDLVFIELKNSYDDMLVEFLTEDGKIVRSKIITKENTIKFNVSDLSAGIYFVKLIYRDNIKTIKVLLVK